MHSAIDADSIMRSVALSIARNHVGANRPITEIIASEGITQQEYNHISANPMYKQYLEGYTTELIESGFSFAAKCRVLAEDLLPDAYKMVKDPDVPAAVRAKVVENLVDWANLKPRKDTAVQTGAGFSINIVFPSAEGQSAPREVIITPEPIEIVENEPIEHEKPAENPLKRSLLGIFDEPDDYEYAGEDVLE